MLQLHICLVGQDCKLHRLYLCKGLIPHHNECREYDTKQSDGEVSLMMELSAMQSASSLPSLPGPLWPGVVALDRVLSMSQVVMLN